MSKREAVVVKHFIVEHSSLLSSAGYYSFIDSHSITVSYYDSKFDFNDESLKIWFWALLSAVLFKFIDQANIHSLGSS